MSVGARAWRRVFFLYVLVSVLVNVWQVGLGSWVTSGNVVARSRHWATTDMDMAGFLLPGLRSKPTLLSTLDWWHGTWAGTVPFWRPLTSLGFWLEYHLLTPDRFDRWMMVSYVCHLAFVGLLVLLVRQLTGRWGVGALAALLFAGAPGLWPLAWVESFVAGGTACPRRPATSRLISGKTSRSSGPASAPWARWRWRFGGAGRGHW